MSKLVTLNGSNDQELLSSIFDNEIVVFEDIQGSKIWVNWDGKEFTIKPKSIGSECGLSRMTGMFFVLRKSTTIQASTPPTMTGFFSPRDSAKSTDSMMPLASPT